MGWLAFSICQESLFHWISGLAGVKQADCKLTVDSWNVIHFYFTDMLQIMRAGPESQQEEEKTLAISGLVGLASCSSSSSGISSAGSKAGMNALFCFNLPPV